MWRPAPKASQPKRGDIITVSLNVDLSVAEQGACAGRLFASAGTGGMTDVTSLRSHIQTLIFFKKVLILIGSYLFSKQVHRCSSQNLQHVAVLIDILNNARVQSSLYQTEYWKKSCL